MKKMLSLFLICFYFVFSMQCHANTIYIHTDNITDLSALENEKTEGNFSATTILHALKSHSSSIQFEYMTTKRSMILMEDNENICAVNKIKTKQRAEEYLFSQPINLFLSRRLYQNTPQPLTDINGLVSRNVSLPAIFKSRPNAKIIISGQISYGDELDVLISKIPEENILLRHSGEHDEGVISMFAAGRAEFALLYPHQVYNWGVDIKWRSYSIDSIPHYVIGRLMCNKNKVTEAFIKNVNTYLSRTRNIEKLLKIHLNYSNSIDREDVKSYFHQEFY